MSRTALAAAALFVLAQRCSCWSFGPMRPEAWEKANRNWNATMKAFHQKEHSANVGTCSQDMRQKTPSCLQYEPDWCWATAVAELSAYYNPTKFPVKGDDCHGFECKVVSYKHDKTNEASCCNNTNFCGDKQTCCKMPFWFGVSCLDKCTGFAKKVDGNLCMEPTCKHIGGTPKDIVEALGHFSGVNFTSKWDGPLPQSQLDTILGKGHPIVIAVMWAMGGGHALTLAGCAGDGTYYLHDPLHKAGVYQTLTYDKIAGYTAPWGTHPSGKWLGTQYPASDLTEEMADESFLLV